MVPLCFQFGLKGMCLVVAEKCLCMKRQCEFSLIVINFPSYDAYDVTSGIGRYANDDWVIPNCNIKREILEGVPYLFLQSIRDIEANTELCYDYNDKTAPWRKQR
jgi:hypothetical protein